MADLPTPTAGRLQRPSWKDTRLLVGVLLVLVAVAGGARAVAMADDTDPVWSAVGQIVPGQELTARDVVAVSVQLGEGAQQYVDASRALEPGTVALRAVHAGELVPRSALGTAQDLEVRVVTVPADAAAAGTFAVGTVVDVWVSPRDEGSAGVRYREPELLLAGAVVSRVPEGGSGLGVGPAGASVQVLIPDDRVADIIASVDQEARVTLVPTPGGPRRGT